MNTSFFGELLQSISDRGRALIERARDLRPAGIAQSQDLVGECEDLLSARGEASGVALARDILLRYRELTTGPRIAFFESLAGQFGAQTERLKAAVDAWLAEPTDLTTDALQHAAEPRRQELLRRLNLAPGGTRALVQMREHLLDVLARRDDLRPVDRDFVHLFSSWFNRGFLVLRHIDWGSPALILEKIIRYEAVHEIRGFDDLRRRIDPPDRRCYAFFHPALVDEPLIFVEVALTRGIPGAIAPILSDNREPIDPAKANTAVFYSISNCQRGLAGVSFGSFLIKQVVEEIRREFPKLSTFVTLSPVPNFASWLDRERANAQSQALSADDRETLKVLDQAGWHDVPELRDRVEAPLLRAAGYYFLRARGKRGRPIDAVARFHLGNGARLEQINFLGDTSEKGMTQSYGLMVNYLYDLDYIEKNHEGYVSGGPVAASNGVSRLLRPQLELVPITG
ncbi:MAG TPA: malonyl-CoA decarboxylase [Pseudolabrys sp.]|nr:malonyl-CoA decarboxylase [Pseudolabrys sp.]